MRCDAVRKWSFTIELQSLEREEALPRTGVSSIFVLTAVHKIPQGRLKLQVMQWPKHSGSRCGRGRCGFVSGLYQCCWEVTPAGCFQKCPSGPSANRGEAKGHLRDVQEQQGCSSRAPVAAGGCSCTVLGPCCSK